MVLSFAYKSRGHTKCVQLRYMYKRKCDSLFYSEKKKCKKMEQFLDTSSHGLNSLPTGNGYLVSCGCTPRYTIAFLEMKYQNQMCGANHAFFRNNKASIWKKHHTVLKLCIFISNKCIITPIFCLDLDTLYTVYSV